MAEGEVIYSQSEKNDFKRIFYKYLRYWYLLLISVVLCMGLAISYLQFASPKYLINSVLLIRDIDKGPDFQSGNPVFKDLDIFNTGSSIENEIEKIKSDAVLERVLTELSLQTGYYISGAVRKKEIYGDNLPISVQIDTLAEEAYKKKITIIIENNKVFQLQDDNNTTHRFGEPIKKPYGSFTVLITSPSLVKQPRKIHITFHDVRDLISTYSKALTVAQVNKKANVLTVNLVDAIPQKGVAILNKLIDVYDKENQENQNQLAIETITFIDDRLKNLTADLLSTEKSIEQFKRQNQVTDVSSEASAYQDESRSYNKQLSDLNIQLDVVESLEKYLSLQKDQYELVPGTLRIDEPTLVELVGKFNELQLQRERVLRTAEPANPLILSLNEQLANLRLNILENLRTIKRVLAVTRSTIAGKASSFQSRINQIPTIERGLNTISRQEGVKRDLYVFLLHKREESAMSLAATVSNTRVINPPSASKLPVEPKKPVIFGLALVLSLLFPFGFIFIRDFLTDKIQRKKDVTRATQIPVLGEIMHHKPNKRGLVSISHSSRTPVAEQFRLIRSNLDFAVTDRENKVILITSSISGEGKTFVSINLSISLSLTGKKVVLLDCDLRHPGVMAGLGLHNEKGVSTYLNNEEVWVDTLLESPPTAPHLSVINAGQVPLNPIEFIINPKMGQLIAKLKDRFDYVIIDSAPVGQVADTFSLAPCIDVTIFVVRYNYTPKVHLDTINDIVTYEKLKHPLIVLNDARRENSDVLGYSYPSKRA